MCAFDDMLAGSRTPSQTQQELKKMVKASTFGTEEAAAAGLSTYGNLFEFIMLQLVASQKENKNNNSEVSLSLFLIGIL